MDAIAKFVGLVVLVLPALATLLALAVLWRGYVLSILWGWFIVPGFGAAPISVPLAIGASMLVAMLTNHKAGDEAKDDSKKWVPLLSIALGPLLALGFGWVVKQYM